MSSLVGDGALIGFWPLNEPSGAPFFRNYANNTFGHKASGVSFNLHVHQAGPNANEEAMSNWPGTTTIFSASSGTNFTGLQLHGRYLNDGVNAQEHAKILTIGNGSVSTRFLTMPPEIAQSGFTVGLWVLPNSDGETGYPETAINGKKTQGFANALFSRGEDDFGWHLGISGQLTGGAQFTSTEFGGDHRLAGYVLITPSTTANPVTDAAGEILETPIEAGRFTHLTFTYRYIDGTNNQVALYKDGRLEASGTTNRDITRGGDTDFFDELITIGGAPDNGSVGGGELEFTTGWNHLMSGAYYFNRVLHEGEVLDMHQCGGMQPELGLQPVGRPVQFDDPNLLGYFGFSTVGFEDASANHRPLTGQSDAGDRDILIISPGPFGRGGVFRDDGGDKIIASSGLTFAFASSPSWTLCARAAFPRGAGATQYTHNMLMSMGSADDILNPVISNSTLGMHISYDSPTTNDRIFARVYPVGDEAAEEVIVQSSDGIIGERITTHVSLLYDNQTKGLALYLDGVLAESGTLTNALYPHLLNLAGSGFPLMFGNAVLDQDPFTVDGVGGLDLSIFEIALFSRPLLPDEIEFVYSSGVVVTPLERTPHDPRLAAYWPCDDFNGDDVIVADKASCWQEVPAHLLFSLSDGKWNTIEGLDTQGPWFTSDPFKTRTLPPELSSFGNLGITSGVFSVLGGSTATLPQSINDDATSSFANPIARLRVNPEDRDEKCNSYLAEWLFSFDVTPSGNIPQITVSSNETNNFNTAIFEAGNGVDFFKCWLTTINAGNADPVGTDAGLGPSGVSIVSMLKMVVLPTQSLLLLET